MIQKKIHVSLKTGVDFTNKPSTGRRGYNWHKDKDFQHFYLILSNLKNLSSLKKKAFFQAEEKYLSLLNKTAVIGSVTRPSFRKAILSIVLCWASGETPSAALLHSASHLFLYKLQSELFLKLLQIFLSPKNNTQGQKYF